MFQVRLAKGPLLKPAGASFRDNSIDPSRDSLANVKAYLADFGDNLTGLVGTPKQVETACRAWRVFYSVPDIYSGSEEYLIDHSMITYLVDPNQKFCEFYEKQSSTTDCAEKVILKILRANTD